MFRPHETGCNRHVPVRELRPSTSYITCMQVLKYTRDVKVSCDNRVAFPNFIASIVVAVVAMYGVHWLAWLPKVCNYQLPV